MTKPVITTRATKGSSLTWTEGDTNLTNLRDATIAIKAGTGGTDVVSDLNGTVTLVAGTNISLSGDNTAKTVTINNTASSGITDVVQDTTPQLGGDLDVNGKNITSATNGNINISPNGSGNINLTPATGHVTISATNFPTGAGTNGQVLTTDGTGNASWSTPSSGGMTDIVQDLSPQLGGDLDVNGKQITSSNNGNINIIPNGSGNINITPGMGKIVLGANDWPSGPGSTGQVLTTAGGTGVLSWTTLSSGGMTDLVQDTTPQLGGALDVNGQQIVSVNNGNINIVPNGSGNINLTPATGKVTISATNFPTGTGTNGQVLTTDGTGNASWATAGSSSNLIRLSTYSISFATSSNAVSTNTWTLQHAGGVSGVSVSTGTITLPAGTYIFSLPQMYNWTASTAIPDFKLRNYTSNLDIITISNSVNFTLGGATTSTVGPINFKFTLSGTTNVGFTTTNTSGQSILGATNSMSLSSGSGATGVTTNMLTNLLIFKVS